MNKFFNLAIALLIGLGIGLSIPSLKAPGHGMSLEMERMTEGLGGKTGDAFDQAFLAEMILHHEGAVAMAESALQNAQHAEIKTMAEAIISAQTSEIAQMKAWLKAWYGL